MPVPVFSVNEVLTSSAMNQVGLWRVNTCTVTSVGGTAATASNGVITIGTGNTSVTVNNAFSSNFDNYRIHYIGGTGSGNNNFSFRLGASATSYSEGLIYNLYTAGAVNGVNRASQSDWVWCGSQSTTVNSLCVDLYRPFLSAFTFYKNANWSIQSALGNSSGVHEVAASYSSFTFAPTAGTITGGTLVVYGYNK